MDKILGNLAFAITAIVSALALAGCPTNNQVILPPPGGAATKAPALVVSDEGNSGSNNGLKFEVFRPTDNGTVAPQATVTGSNTNLHRVETIWRDAAGNFLAGDDFEGNSSGTCTTTFSSGQVLIFAPGANGNVAPARSISGSNTTLDDSVDGMVEDSNGNIYVTQRDTTTDSCAPTHATARILVFAAGASGNVAPPKRIIGANTQLNSPRQLTFDSSGRLWVVDEHAPDVEAFDLSGLVAGDNNTAPVIRITSASFSCPQGVAVDASSNVYVGDPCRGSIFRFNAITASCLACTPNNTINGANTHLASPQQIATDGTFIFVANDNSAGPHITVYGVTDTGNVAPTRQIFDSTASLMRPRGLSL